MHNKTLRQYSSILQSVKGENSPAAERRPQRRKRVLLGGIVSYSGGVFSLNCTIRDLSESGARIVFSSNQPLPTEIFFINIRDGVVHEAEVVWHKGKAAGIKFLSTLPLHEINDPKLTYLKDLWHAHATRGLLDI